MKNFAVVTLMIFFSSCASNNSSGLKPRSLEDYYISTGVEKYFLNSIPAWANFDQKAGCFRQSSIRYLDLDALMKSYSINYNKALQVQAAFNEEYIQFQKMNHDRPITLKEDELIFFKVSDKVSNKIIFFDAPHFKRVNLIWIDEILGDKSKEKKLKNLLNSKEMEEGVPVLVSFCLMRTEIESLFPSLEAKSISAEMLSVFDSSGIRKPAFQIELDQFFDQNQSLFFYSQKNFVPIDVLKGNYKTINY